MALKLESSSVTTVCHYFHSTDWFCIHCYFVGSAEYKFLILKFCFAGLLGLAPWWKTHLRDSCMIRTKFSGNKFLLTWKHGAFLAWRQIACRLKKTVKNIRGGALSFCSRVGVLSLTYHLHTIKAPLKPLQGQWVLLIRREATQNWTETKIKTKKGARKSNNAGLSKLQHRGGGGLRNVSRSGVNAASAGCPGWFFFIIF